LTLLCTLTLVAQNKTKIDSLENLLKTKITDTIRVNTLNALAGKLKYYNVDTAILLAKQAAALASRINFPKGEAKAYHTASEGSYEQGDYPKQMGYLVKELKIEEELNNRKNIASIINSIGVAYANLSDYSKALEYLFEALKIEEELETPLTSLFLIGVLYYQQSIHPIIRSESRGEFEEFNDRALTYYFKELKIAEELKDTSWIFVSIGLVHLEQANEANSSDNYQKADSLYKKALGYFFKSLEIEGELETKNFGNTFQAYSSIGNIYQNLGDLSFKTLDKDNYYDKALFYYFKASEMSTEPMVLSNIGSLYTKRKKYKEAERYLLQASEISKEKSLENHFYTLDEIHVEQALSLLYEETGRWQKAFEYNKKVMVLKYSLFNEEKDKAITRREMQYEFDKEQERQKAEQEKKDIEKAAESKRQKVIIWSVSGGLLLLVVFAFFIANRLRITRRQKTVIEEQKELVDEKNKEILDSITYAQRIQEAILPTDKLIKEHLPNSFVLFKPKDIVSGDFYWLEANNGKVMFAAVDCTGHGVPGAFVSIVGHSGLNRAVNDFGKTRPAEILDTLNELVEDTFAKSESEIKDGMDIALCCLDLQNKTIEYAGANNPLYYIQNGEVQEIKGDKQPIGRHEDRQPFINHTLDINEGDCSNWNSLCRYLRLF